LLVGVPFRRMARPEPRSANEWLADYGGAVLIVVGLSLAGLGFAAADSARSVPLVIMGAGAAILGVLLPRVAGPVKVSPSGIEAVLTAVGLRAIQRKADELGIPPGEKDKLVDEALALFGQRNVTILTPAAKAVAGMPVRKARAEPTGPVEQLQSLGYEAIVETAEKLAEEAVARAATTGTVETQALRDVPEEPEQPEERT
jgi:hypothetical protein